MSDTAWTGTDIFGRPLCAVRGRDRSVILSACFEPDDEDGDEDDEDGRAYATDRRAMISLSPASVCTLAAWLVEGPDAAKGTL